MLTMVSALLGLLALAVILMAADWYIWEPRYAGPHSSRAERPHRHDDVHIRSAA